MAREEGFFDKLVRGLADGTLTRGKALRLMGAALVGGALGSLGIGGEAGADPPGCKRNGKNCTRNEQCCSENCASGKCASACPDGRVLLCNGTCARTCTSDADCTGCNFVCGTEAGSDPSRSLCSNVTDFAAPCETSCDCPSGQFCRQFPLQRACVFAC